jgi:hypothetical protein
LGEGGFLFAAAVLVVVLGAVGRVGVLAATVRAVVFDVAARVGVGVFGPVGAAVGAAALAGGLTWALALAVLARPFAFEALAAFLTAVFHRSRVDFAILAASTAVSSRWRRR